MEKLVILILGAGLYLLAAALLWWLWGVTFGYFWPDGPATLINPDFWPFFGAFVLIRLLLGRS